jgi:hypothetical protein
MLCPKAAVLNLGYAYPWGYAGSSQGVRNQFRGDQQNYKKHPKEDYMGIMFDQGVRKRGPILIWGYAERYNFDLGVRKYQKVENPWFRQFKLSPIS